MKKELLDILCCPESGSDLDLVIEEGDLNHIKKGKFLCSQSGMQYEIFDDIPYFSSKIDHKGIQNQFETYSHWFEEMHDEESIINPEHEKLFSNSLNINKDEIENKLVLDAGCGNGRFSYVVSGYDPKLLVSFDISQGLGKAKETILKHNPNANISFIQGDVTKPPFKKEAFDIVYSWGVTHHTPNTKKTVRTLSKLVKEEGLFGIYVYVFNPSYEYDKQFLGLLAYLRSFLLIRPFRFICSRLPVNLVKLIFQPIYYFEKLIGFGIFGNHGYPHDPFNKDRYFRVVVDRFKTRYASEHKEEEIFKWFFDQGYSDLRVGSPKVSISGVKSKGTSSVKKVTFFD
tara:strand:- start:7647 stop:8675 length:1029 start_codon:yes stop_codon:yes gene_type:complete